LKAHPLRPESEVRKFFIGEGAEVHRVASG
jgi:hypothetical protein